MVRDYCRPGRKGTKVIMNDEIRAGRCNGPSLSIELVERGSTSMAYIANRASTVDQKSVDAGLVLRSNTSVGVITDAGFDGRIVSQKP